MIARAYHDRTYLDGEGNSVHEPKLIISVTTTEDIELFKQLMRRAVNTWDDAPPQVKELADIVTEGKILQNYHSQYWPRKS